VPGNHDYDSRGAEPYYEYFGANAGPPGLGYSSFNLGSWHVVALNSNIDMRPGSPQGVWLRNDLATRGARCTVAYWHHPLFTSGPSGPTSAVQELWYTLYDAGVELVLNGHEHLYERFAPQDPEGHVDTTGGIRQIIAGTGGAPGYATTGLAFNSEVRLTGEFGVLKLTLLSDSYQWDFVPVSGRGDSGTGQCH